MGFAPTKKYITSTYNIEIDENAGAQEKNLKANKANLAALKGSLKALDKFDKATEELDVGDDEIQNALNKLIASSETYEEAFDKLYELYDLPFEKLEPLMFKAVANAQMLGYLDEI